MRPEEITLKRVREKSQLQGKVKIITLPKNPPKDLAYLRFKFELLKRNTAYQQDYKQLKKKELFDKWGCDLDPDIPLNRTVKEELYGPFCNIRVMERAIPDDYYCRLIDDLPQVVVVQDNWSRMALSRMGAGERRRSLQSMGRLGLLSIGRKDEMDLAGI
jgi:hypothetical protein